jgi:hypothetical protein
VSALVVEHLRLHPDEREGLVALLVAPRELTDDAAVNATIARFRDGGALAAATARIERLEREVLGAPALTAVPDLHAVAVSLVERMRRLA